MVDRRVLVTLERRGTWARQFRPRAAAWSIRLVETRSGPDLEAAIRGTCHALLVVDLGDRPARGLSALGAAMAAAPSTLALVLDPGDHGEGVSTLARELGATLVLRGQVAPPVVLGLLNRWRGLSDRRSALEGWRGEAPRDDELFAEFLAPAR